MKFIVNSWMEIFKTTDSIRPKVDNIGLEKLRKVRNLVRVFGIIAVVCILHGGVGLVDAGASGDIDACISQPCLNGGTCHDTIDSYTCSCAHLFNGTNCENDLAIYGCQVDPCLNGGTCVEDATSSNNYRCECRQGYAGSNCEADIDECGFTPCHNGVPCADLVGTFSCNCTGSGYSGELCDQDIDECDTANICGAQGTCFNNPGSYTCGCPPGEFGNPCQDINECQSSPCRHSGTCQNLDNEYNCVCVPGYRGKQCEEDIDDCIGAVCPAQYSECRDLVNNHSCVCKAGYRGTPPTCQDINECDPDPCQHGSTCADQVNAYHCACIAGYEGPTCATNINDCDPDLCLNGASCVDHVNNYTCTCVAGFEGRHCETNINECDKFATPCHNGGTCHDQVNGFNCSCVHGYTGSICQENINECDPDPCVATHSSGCTDGVGVFTCSCLPGYNGDRCEADINECWPNLCQNGATCTDLVNGYNCTCLPDWMGERCELVYDACIPEFANCENGANCSTTPPSKQFSCMCVVGFDGQRCERNIDDCQPDPCQLPHVCYDGVNSHTCACNIGYEGTNCDHLIDECRSTPCSNGATCNSGIGVYTCECPQLNVTIPLTDRWFITGYHGDNCEIDIDECTITPPICLNNGRCENMDGDFQCFCGRDQQGNLYFTGNHCELEISYCSIADDLPACKNNGTCIAEVRDFRCECAAGFKGLRCEIDINECESNPCHWNGTCEDRIAAYVCSCIDGITGPNCETNIDECESNPCLQEAPCIDGINEFTCNCTDTGFKGDTCEINIDDCEPQPCQHGATCYDKIKDYDCHCFPGYSGKNCETDINECLNNPCDDTYPGTCYEKSNETNYEVDTAGFENLNFSFANAAGYICQCIKGITGTNCTENINDCVDDNCHNGTCHDLIDAYECVCHPGYEGTNCDTEINECLRYEPCGDRGICTDKIDDYECDCNLMYNAGKNCTFRLTSCDSHNCQNGASCTPFLVDELTSQQDYSCVCSTGFTGHYCDVSTTMSFSSGSYIHVTLDSTTDVLMSFRFRTTLQDSLLLAWQGADTTGLFSTVELKNGALHLLYHDPTQVGVLSKISIPKVFSNAEWQTVTLSINTDTSFLTFKVESSSCTNEYECIRMANYDSQILAFQSIYMGNINDAALLSSTESGTRFVGCMEDVTYAGNKLVLDPNSLMFHQLANGCPRQEQCFPDTCNNKGHCVDMWNEFVCNCRRPNLGTTCDTSYTAATFAYNNAISSATFTLPQAQTDALKLNMDLSFFLRSRKPNGLILFLGNVNSNFLSVELLDGKIAVRMKFCGTEEFIFSTDNAYTDGEQHFVEIVRQDGDMNLSVDGVFNSGKQFSSNCILDVSSILFGDPSEIQNGVRKRRQAVTAPVEDFASATYFKGTIQDVQLNTNSLQFYPLSDPSLSNLPKILLSESASLEENEKTDPICDMVSPCEKNSTCSDVFYNDYSCDCLHGYRGKNCSDLDFCVTGECPAGSTCHSLLDGFECISVSTFDGLQSLAWYDHTLSNTSTIETISIKFRTLAYNGRILQIDNGDSRYYKVKVVGSHVVVVYNLDGSEMSLEAQYDISDSQWYMAVVKETHDTVTLTLYENDQVLSNVSSSKPTTGDNLTSLLRDGAKRIILGRVSDSPGDPRIPNYHGCLTEVRIGKILLPFFYDDNFINDTSVERFLLTKRNQIPVGCIAGTDTNCPRNQCHHGSDCIPDYYSYRCNCSAGYDGRWCQDRRDYCMVDSCENGHCVSRTDIYECECPSGYTGSRCQTDVDECATGVCQNNATCYNQNGTYTCNCSDLYTGDNCEIQLNRTCSDSPCEHGRTCTNITITDGATGLDVESFNCSCNPGYHGYTCAVAIDYCENFPCQNGATCNSWTENQDFNCTCANGYSGDTCDVNIDDCPSQTLCLHGGVCVDGLMTHVCNCTDTVYWTGERCEVDIDECTIQQPCQNGTSCLNKDEGYKCNCTNTGYQGIHCADDIDECTTANPCLKEANCTNTIGSYDCSCTVGYEGKDCGIANCTDVPCVNGATCVEIFTNTQWRCSCPTYYEGTYCQVKGPCADEPCENNNTDTCTQDVTADTYTCHCGQGWEGTNCTTDIDECTVTSGICQNGATCVNLDGSYRCDCVFGYNGTNCEKNIDECAGRPCHNHGICIDGVGGFTCNCTETGYTNLTCMEDVNECEESEPCLHDGTCNNTVGSYECACKETYEGKDCEIKRDAIMEDDDITWFIVGPSVAVVLILIVIGVIWFLMCVRTKRATRGAYSPSRQEVTGSRVELGNVLKKPPPERLI